MKRLIQLIRHALALYRVRALEIRLHDVTNAERLTEEQGVENTRRRRILSRELVHARIRLSEFLKPGDRKTWRIA